MQTYHTRPMPGGWSKQHDIRKLVDSKAAFDFEIPLTELPGVPETLRGEPEPARVHARFERSQGWNVVDLKVAARVGLICQRCLRPLEWHVDAHSRIALLQSQEEAQDVPEDLEVFMAENGYTSVAALAGEELMLALPSVPLHGEAERCESDAAGVERVSAPVATPEAGATTRPFADLAALLKHGKDED